LVYRIFSRVYLNRSSIVQKSGNIARNKEWYGEINKVTLQSVFYFGLFLFYVIGRVIYFSFNPAGPFPCLLFNRFNLRAGCSGSTFYIQGKNKQIPYSWCTGHRDRFAGFSPVISCFGKNIY